MSCLLSEPIRRDGSSEDRPRRSLHSSWLPWEALDRLRPLWMRRARRAGIHREDAEDLFQEALLASIEGLDRLRQIPGRSIEEAYLAWLWGILRHKLISSVRRRKRRLDFEQRVRARPAPERDARAVQRLRSSLDLLERASPEAARILRRRFYDGWELSEMADDLGVSVPTACRRVQAALAEMRGCMERTLS